MAQATRSATLTRVNRRFLLLALILAGLSAVLIYAAVSRSDSGGGGSSATSIPVVVAQAAIPAGTEITADMLAVQQIPQAGVGAQALGDVSAAVGQVARYPIAANEQVLASKLVSGTATISEGTLGFVVEEGMRGMAIQTTAVIGAGGLVLPGDHIDILWVPEDPVEDFTGAGLIAENVEVLAVQQTLVDLPAAATGAQGEEGDEGTTTDADAQTTGDRVRSTESEPIPDAVTVTLLLSPEEASRVFCAENGGSLRLAVRSFGDDGPSNVPPAVCVIESNREEAA